MKIIDLPDYLINGQRVKLISPNVSYNRDMYKLISSFSDLHYEFLLWSHNQYSPELCYKNLEIATNNFENDQDEYKFLIVDSHTNDLVGCISLFIINPEIPFYEIGYWISSNSMQNNFATEACNLVKDIACHYLKCKRLEIKMARRNIHSAKVAIRTGFQLEAILKNHRLDGFNCIDDTCIYTYPLIYSFTDI